MSSYSKLKVEYEKYVHSVGKESLLQALAIIAYHTLQWMSTGYTDVNNYGYTTVKSENAVLKN